ncbi:hypothetical protein ASPZODRAFT_27376 [Penicilliopsis zonata CBS 506.65]|uniref:Uncharacterized protein n=1 Tax=Penicilliopsis zonata CBS 506.65 TaxID=1073090 RepID=A0A1L9SC70_9EURO|nr:hypothetical protein ASPZODRAFT_27376 [Penicilliopsis zonata CBS 506.65]OJJ44739.1 hypothetical protein ASPZODRAFT_27376 [Penicilliopsis zonata CBS 506.65]
MDTDVVERLNQLQMADLGTARREHISTTETKQNLKSIGDVKLEDIEATRESNVAGSEAHRLAQANKSLLAAWSNVYREIGDTGDLEALDSLLNGQSHRVQLSTMVTRPGHAVNFHKPIRGSHTAGAGRGGGIIGTRGRSSSYALSLKNVSTRTKATASISKSTSNLEIPRTRTRPLDPALDHNDEDMRQARNRGKRGGFRKPPPAAIKARRPVPHSSEAPGLFESLFKAQQPGQQDRAQGMPLRRGGELYSDQILRSRATNTSMNEAKSAGTMHSEAIKPSPAHSSIPQKAAVAKSTTHTPIATQPQLSSSIKSVPSPGNTGQAVAKQREVREPQAPKLVQSTPVKQSNAALPQTKLPGAKELQQAQVSEAPQMTPQKQQMAQSTANIKMDMAGKHRFQGTNFPQPIQAHVELPLKMEPDAKLVGKTPTGMLLDLDNSPPSPRGLCPPENLSSAKQDAAIMSPGMEDLQGLNFQHIVASTENLELTPSSLQVAFNPQNKLEFNGSQKADYQDPSHPTQKEFASENLPGALDIVQKVQHQILLLEKLITTTTLTENFLRKLKDCKDELESELSTFHKASSALPTDSISTSEQPQLPKVLQKTQQSGKLIDCMPEQAEKTDDTDSKDNQQSKPGQSPLVKIDKVQNTPLSQRTPSSTNKLRESVTAPVFVPRSRLPTSDHSATSTPDESPSPSPHPVKDVRKHLFGDHLLPGQDRRVLSDSIVHASKSLKASLHALGNGNMFQPVMPAFPQTSVLASATPVVFTGFPSIPPVSNAPISTNENRPNITPPGNSNEPPLFQSPRRVQVTLRHPSQVPNPLAQPLTANNTNRIANPLQQSVHAPKPTTGPVILGPGQIRRSAGIPGLRGGGLESSRYAPQENSKPR